MSLQSLRSGARRSEPSAEPRPVDLNILGRIRALAGFRREISLESSLREIMLWLSRAQDATDDDGVAQAYFTRDRRWGASYPETTGYIIPTFFDYARLSGSAAFYDRAVRMADWESAIQLVEGGVQAGTVDARQVVPTIFNTGMVIFGWVRAFEETKKRSYLESALKAGDWLVSVQDEDGAWRRYSSPVTLQTVNTYNTRVSWALSEIHRITRDGPYLRSARKNLDWALTQQLPNGWLENNCLLDNEQPYTHTIAYAMRGFLEAGAYLKDSRYVDAAEKIFLGVQNNIRGDGFLPGRFDRDWRPTVRYCCLTGNAQLATNGFRLYQLTGNEMYRSRGRRLVDYVLRTQNLETNDLNVRGAIAGSWPMKGRYHPYQYPNWAAKFTADAVMKWMEIEQSAKGKEQRRETSGQEAAGRTKTMDNRFETMEKISAFLARNHDSAREALAVDPEESLMAAGLIDSLGILKLIAFIEVEFNIELQPDEVNMQNFDSLASITRLVESHLK